MNEARRSPQGFAALAPEHRRRIASLGGHARRTSGAPYAITPDNARAIAERRWSTLAVLDDDARSQLARCVARLTATVVARVAGVARSTLQDALRGARITPSTAQHIARVLEHFAKESP
jgi:hypothetical protein